MLKNIPLVFDVGFTFQLSIFKLSILQPSNIFSKFSHFETSQLDKSHFIFEHPQNIPSICVTLETSQFERLHFNLGQLLNISGIDLIFEIFQFFYQDKYVLFVTQKYL